MNSNDCELTITVYYKDKSFEMKTKEIITIETLKQQAIQKFNISKLFQERIKFYIQCQNKQKIYIHSEDEIILNADDSNIDNPKIALCLSVNDDKENNNTQNDNKNVGYNFIIIKKQSEKNKNKNNNKYLEDFANLKNDINTLSEMLEEEKKKNNLLMKENINLKKKVEAHNHEIKSIKDTLKSLFLQSKNNENVKNMPNLANNEKQNKLPESIQTNDDLERKEKNNNNKTEDNKNSKIINNNNEKNEENGNQENNNNNNDNNNVSSISIEEKEKNLNDNLKNNNNYVPRTVKEDVNVVSEGVRREQNKKDNCTSQIFQESKSSQELQEPEKSTLEEVREKDNKISTSENFESKASKDNKSDTKNSTNQNNNNLEEMVEKIRKEYGSDLDKISHEKIKEKLQENDGDFERALMDLMLATTSLIKGKK